MTTLPVVRRTPAPVRTIAAVLAVLLGIAVMIGVGSSPAHAASRVDVSTTPNADGATTVTLTGTGFQYQPNAPGGIYVFFGIVSDPATNAWAPSQGGASGSTYSYASTRGSQLLVAFEGGSSASASNATIRSDGTWTATMTIPGSRFTATFGDPHSGSVSQSSQVDCLQLICGIITIGAHGRWNANNESFTPVGFRTGSGEVVSGTERPSFTDEATVVDIPSAEEAPGEEAHEASAEPPIEQSAAPLAEADAGAGAGSGTTYLVFGVLGLAVLALLAAVIVFVARRGKGRASPSSAQDPESSQEIGEKP